MAGMDGRLNIEIFPASFGDAILVRCESDCGTVNMLIDGGVGATYEEHLAARLQGLHSRGEKLDVVVVTHIDGDHIGGVLGLLSANGPARAPRVIDICDVWHNGYRHLNLNGRAPSESEKKKVLSQVSNAQLGPRKEGEISVKHAQTLATLITKYGYAWNKAFGGKAAVSGQKVSLAPGIDITLLSPGPQNLDRLAYVWRKGLVAMGVSHEAVDCSEFESAFEMEVPRLDADADTPDMNISASTITDPPSPSTFIEDTSITNGSSIAFLLECFGLRTLFLGDSWPGVVADQLELLHPGQSCQRVDLVKVSHHGSRHNTSPALLDRLKARHYVISTDGAKHDHPDMGALLWIADACEAGSSLVFNYPSDTARRMGEANMLNRFGHKVSIGTGKAPLLIVISGEASGKG